MTNRLYYTDSYRTEFSSVVSERTSDGTRVYLDETAFYPTSGGQPHDLGTLGGTRVIDVVDEGERIAHVLAAPLGDHVERRDDAPERRPDLERPSTPRYQRRRVHQW